MVIMKKMMTTMEEAGSHVTTPNFSITKHSSKIYTNIAALMVAKCSATCRWSMRTTVAPQSPRMPDEMYNDRVPRLANVRRDGKANHYTEDVTLRHRHQSSASACFPLLTAEYLKRLMFNQDS